MAKDTRVLTTKNPETYTEAQDIEIPDLWHIAMFLKDKPDLFVATQGQAILDTWHLAHSMKQHIIES